VSRDFPSPPLPARTLRVKGEMFDIGKEERMSKTVAQGSVTTCFGVA
jgi:hypothetical protein